MFLNEINKVNDIRGIMIFMKDFMLLYDVILNFNFVDFFNGVF